MSGPQPQPSDAEALSSACSALAATEPIFARLIERNGVPPLWRREPSYATVVRLILEQQVSLASATAAYARLARRVGDVTPEAILSSTDAELRADGFSRQKAGYVRDIATAVVDGSFDPAAVASDRDEAVTALLALRGVGPWTASCYALFAMGEQDVWPTGDRALHVAVARVFELASVPTTGEAEALARAWSPYRSAAARMLWHDYLGGAAYTVSEDAGFL
jgi:DNA-3-methyladenine glycosylase II